MSIWSVSVYTVNSPELGIERRALVPWITALTTGPIESTTFSHSDILYLQRISSPNVTHCFFS